MQRVHNFNAGPAVLPLSVLERAQAELLDYQGRGMSILEMSHRSPEYEAINNEAETRLKQLLGVGDNYRVLFMQGGASAQFALVPMNLLPHGAVADYIVSGVWGEKAVEEARRIGTAHVAATTRESGYRAVPQLDAIQLSDNPAYIHLTSNETIQGTQWAELPSFGATPLVIDMSSDILSRQIPTEQIGLIYGGAQKNIGPAGVTVVVIRQDLLERVRKDIPVAFSYAIAAKNNSLYNTPPVFSVYMLNLVLGWIEEQGGVAAIERQNLVKSGLLYAVIDNYSGFYRGHAEFGSRSTMNVTFRLPEEALEQKFLAEAQAAGMVGLAGHRSVGGIRASLYNALPIEACTALASFMNQFVAENG
jgi:phosphoserine aminotransferase